MDLGTMEQKCKKHQYHSVETFLGDLEKIHRNSVIFNGETSIFTQKAKEIFTLGKEMIEEVSPRAKLVRV